MAEPKPYAGPTGPAKPGPADSSRPSQNDGQVSQGSQGNTPKKVQRIRADERSSEIASAETGIWCESEWLGRPLTPLVVSGGRVYFATTNFGLVCLKRGK